MTLITRRYLYIIFLSAFFIITPIVIMYANGYQFSSSKTGLIKTGMLIVDSDPKGAKILLNNQPEQTFTNKILRKNNYIITPAKIKNVVPGEYDVKFEIDGYFPWQKKIKINPGESTYAEDVTLFKKSQPKLLTDTPLENINQTNDGSKLIASDSRHFAAIEMSSPDKIFISTSSGSASAWSQDKSWFIVGKKLFNTDSRETPINLDAVIGQNISNLKFAQSGGNNIYYQINSQIFSYNFNDKQSKNIFSSTDLGAQFKNSLLKDFLINDNRAYLVLFNQGRANVINYDLDNKKIVRDISLTTSDSIKIINQDHQFINILDKNYQNIYLLNFTSYNPLEDTIDSANNGIWVNGSKMVGWNDAEIFIYDINIKQKNLISRLSQKINQAIWHPSNNYIIYSTDTSVVAFELDDRDKHNTTELTTAEKIYRIAISPDARWLYFTGTVNKQPGLYQIELK